MTFVDTVASPEWLGVIIRSGSRSCIYSEGYVHRTIVTYYRIPKAKGTAPKKNLGSTFIVLNLKVRFIIKISFRFHALQCMVTRLGFVFPLVLVFQQLLTANCCYNRKKQTAETAAGVQVLTQYCFVVMVHCFYILFHHCAANI